MSNHHPHLVLGPDGLPVAPANRDVVLHTRVVTETGGGPDKTILLSSPFLAHTNYWLAAAYMHPPGDKGFDAIKARAEQWNSPLIGVPDKGALDLRPLFQLRRLLKKYRVKIWHGHDYKSDFFGLLLRPFHKMKLVTTVHGWVKHTNRTPLYYKIDKWCLKRYAHVICVSDDLYETVRALGVPEDRCTLVHNAIDEKTFNRAMEPRDAPLRARMKTPAGRLVIGAVGRLSPEKGFDLLIKAAANLIAAGLDIELWIAGDGDEKPKLEKQIAELNLGDRVKLLGFVSDTIGLYQALDLFVLSSLREGLPNVVLEALAMRVPVVSTMVAGVPKMIADGREGLLVPTNDADALTIAMKRAVEDAELRQRLANHGRALIEAKYSFTRRMEKVKAIYDRVLGVQATTDHAATAIQSEPRP